MVFDVWVFYFRLHQMSNASLLAPLRSRRKKWTKRKKKNILKHLSSLFLISHELKYLITFIGSVFVLCCVDPNCSESSSRVETLYECVFVQYLTESCWCREERKKKRLMIQVATANTYLIDQEHYWPCCINWPPPRPHRPSNSALKCSPV